MFDIGWSELLVIGVVAIVVVGPKELPRLMRTFGHYSGKLRAMASDFQRQFEDAVRDSEIDEVRKAMQDVHTQASDATRAATDKPLMMPKPAAPKAAALPEPKAKAKPRAKKDKAGPAKTATDNVAPAKTPPAKTPPVKAPRAKKRGEGAP